MYSEYSMLSQMECELYKLFELSVHIGCENESG
jgi:hypothetical protein